MPQTETAPAMPPALTAACERIRQLLVNADQGDACARYEVGGIVAQVRSDPQTYGARSMPRLGEALGWHRTTLYRYAAVAERWDEQRFLSLLEHRNRSGPPLTWRHLETLARVADESESQALLDATLSGDLTAVQLGRRLLQTRRAIKQRALPSGDAVLRDAIRKLLAHLTGVIESADHFETDAVAESLSDGAAFAPDVLLAIDQCRDRCVVAASRAARLAALLAAGGHQQSPDRSVAAQT